MLWMLTLAQAATWNVSAAPAGAAWVADAAINGACRTAAGVCTLRAALDEAIAAGGPQTIVLPAGDFPVPTTLGTGTLTLTGAGRNRTRLTQTGGTLLHASDVTITDLTIFGGRAASADPVITGAGGVGWLGVPFAATIRLERVGLDALRGPAIEITNDDAFDVTTGVSHVYATDLVMRRSAGPLVTLAGGYYLPSAVELDGLQVEDAAITGDLFNLRYGRLTAYDVDIRRSTISGATVRAIDSTASLDGVRLRGNHVGDLLGVTGGPSLDFGALTYVNLLATGNTSDRCGATADAWSYVGLDHSVVASNTLGGAVLCGQAHVSRSTIAANVVTAGDGGALRVSGYLPYDAWVRDSQIVRNRTVGSGGGIWSNTPGGPDVIEISGCTLLDNEADADLDGLGEGGNLWASSASIQSTVLAGGVAGGAASDCVGSFALAQANFVAVEPAPGACNMAGAHTIGSVAAPADPLLSGPVTLPDGRVGFYPLRGSPLIDAGTPRGGLDFAGQSRAIDGDADGVAVPDIGAVERNIP